MLWRGDTNGGELEDGKRVGRIIKNKKTLNLVFIFFLGQSAELTKTDAHLGQPLPQRLPGVVWADSPSPC